MSQVLLIVKVDDNLVHHDERDAEIFNAIQSLEFVKDITVYKPDPEKIIRGLLWVLILKNLLQFTMIH